MVTRAVSAISLRLNSLAMVEQSTSSTPVESSPARSEPASEQPLNEKVRKNTGFSWSFINHLPCFHR
jgi:hypothetical protein